MAANSISNLTLKKDRQDQKLQIAEAKRQGKKVAIDGTISGTADSTKPYHRTLNTLDASRLPTRYHATDNTGDLTDNANTGGLQPGRPWT